MTKRTRLGNFYVERNRLGQIKRWVRIRKSLGADRRKRAVRVVRSGYGHLGDHRR